jgi:hypothetical protein
MVLRIDKKKSPWPKGVCPIPMNKRFQKGDPRINRKGPPTKIEKIQMVLNRLGGYIAPAEVQKQMSVLFPHVKNMTMHEAIIARAYMDALRKGDHYARDFIAERMEGKIAQVVKLGEVEKERTPLTDAECAAAAKALKISPSDKTV